MTRVPDRITSQIRELGRIISPNADIIYVNSEPVPSAQVSDCFPAVERQVVQEGGEVVYGWQIWEWPTLFIEAEFHAVWKTIAGDLLDITPKPFPCSQILFIRDAVRIYESRQVKNVYLTISSHPAVKAFLDLRDAEFEILNLGDRAYQHTVILSEFEEIRMADIRRERLQLQLELMSLTSTLEPLGPNEPCHCGSGKKYVKCCRVA